MAENYINAENDYMLGMKYKDIAAKYGVTINTVKSWKQRYGWSKGKEGAHTKGKKVCTQKKKGMHTKMEQISACADPEAVSSGGLSDNQRLFCLYYVKYRNKTKAYQKAYQCSYENACDHAWRLWKNEEVRKEIDRILEEVCQDIQISIRDLIQQQIDIARADITDFVDLSAGGVQIAAGMDGTLVREIKDTKDGISLKLYDKQKAIDWLADHLHELNGGQKNTDDMMALAEIILNSRPNRSLEDYE